MTPSTMPERHAKIESPCCNENTNYFRMCYIESCNDYEVIVCKNCYSGAGRESDLVDSGKFPKLSTVPIFDITSTRVLIIIIINF